ncbi:MAG: L-serine ammonia-lyase, iron-sulfur-dependent, subunit alpha [Clostridiaceae bacterium]|nr:L-serine ammonia-lyase, iron-sulfur-dependent, subunit alpha [Eubacteriales bacterium]
MSYDFRSGEELLALCERDGLPIYGVMLKSELEREERDEQTLNAEMLKNLETMRTSAKSGVGNAQATVSGLMGGDAELLHAYAEKSLCGSRMNRAAAAAMGVLEVNASMGKIVAAPTAGASGVLPGTLLTCAEDLKWDDETLVRGLYTAGAVGALVAANASVSGAAGGCQAETGTAAAMAAAALVELSGGTPEMALDAAAIALKNVMGLVCDPVAGLVECPCIKRNAIGAANAMLSADLALAGVKSLIPFDEVVVAMKNVGRAMSSDLRETARGGLAATPTAKALRKKLGLYGAERE